MVWQAFLFFNCRPATPMEPMDIPGLLFQAFLVRFLGKIARGTLGCQPYTKKNRRMLIQPSIRPMMINQPVTYPKAEMAQVCLICLIANALISWSPPSPSNLNWWRLDLMATRVQIKQLGPPKKSASHGFIHTHPPWTIKNHGVQESNCSNCTCCCSIFCLAPRNSADKRCKASASGRAKSCDLYSPRWCQLDAYTWRPRFGGHTFKMVPLPVISRITITPLIRVPVAPFITW